MKDLLLRNFWLKLFCLATAFTIWYLFAGARELTMSISVPVQYRNIPKSIEISSNIVEQVHLILRGPALQLSRLSPSASPVILDLAEVRSAGQTTFTIDRRNVSLPTGVILERSIPTQIPIRTELMLERSVPVRPRLEHVPADLRIESILVSPEYLAVAGPRSRVLNIDHVDTDPVDVSERDLQGRLETTALTGDAQIRFTSSPRVHLRISIQPGLAPASKK